MGAFHEAQTRDRILAFFIDEDPMPLVLHRPVWALSAAGGRILSSEVILPAQDFYFVPFRRRVTQEYGFNPQSFGEEEMEYIHYLMIGKHGVDVKPEDYFVNTDAQYSRLADGRYEVKFVGPRDWDRVYVGFLWRELDHGPPF